MLTTTNRNTYNDHINGGSFNIDNSEKVGRGGTEVREGQPGIRTSNTKCEMLLDDLKPRLAVG